MHDILNHRGIVTSTRAPFINGAGDEDDHKRLEFTQRIFHRLRERGIHGVRGFRVMLHNMDIYKDGQLAGRALEGALSHMGIRLKRSEYERMISLFGTGEHAEDDLMDYIKLLAYGWSNWSRPRQEVVRQAYDDLCSSTVGSMLTVAALMRRFSPQALTSAHVPELTAHESAHEFFQQWCDSELASSGLVMWLDFVEYYLDVSVCVYSEKDFCNYVCSSWGLDMDDVFAKQIFRRYACEDDPDVMKSKDFARMLRELNGDITRDEAAAWYETVDEEGFGEVNLQEFLSSKVLKVKRSFDKFDVDHPGILNMEVASGGSPNPNIAKLKALFDKYDQEETGILNIQELEAMLKELFANSTDKDAEILSRMVCPEGTEPCATFSAYIRRFQDISQKYAQLRTAKR